MGQVFCSAGPTSRIGVPGLVFRLALGFLFRRLVEIGTAVWAFAGPSYQIAQVVQGVALALQGLSRSQTREQDSSHFTHLNDFDMALCQSARKALSRS